MNNKWLVLIFLLTGSSASWASRTPYATERLELTAYKVWAISKSAHGCRSVYVMDPDSYIYHLSPGDYIGRKNGKIESIDNKGMVVIELVPDGKGDWKEHRARMDLPAEMRSE